MCLHNMLTGISNGMSILYCLKNSCVTGPNVFTSSKTLSSFCGLNMLIIQSCKLFSSCNNGFSNDSFESITEVSLCVDIFGGFDLFQALITLHFLCFCFCIQYLCTITLICLGVLCHFAVAFIGIK